MQFIVEGVIIKVSGGFFRVVIETASTAYDKVERRRDIELR